MTSLPEGWDASGQRVVLTDPRSSERTYATVCGNGSRPESIMINVDGRFYNPQEHWRANITPAVAERDMVIGDLLNLDMLKAIFERPFLGSLWTHGDRGILTPHVCECSFGDGLKLVKIFTINQRPNYHVVRVDSTWAESNWDGGQTIGEHIDEIVSAIEDECGRAGESLDQPCDNCGDMICKCSPDFCSRDHFPEIDADDGCSWDVVAWWEIEHQFGVTPHAD